MIITSIQDISTKVARLLLLTAFIVAGCNKNPTESKDDLGVAPKQVVKVERSDQTKPAIETIEDWIININEKARKGDAAAQLILASYYGNQSFHNKVEEEAEARKKAFDWAIKASTSSDAAAQYMVGRYYAEGLGTMKSALKSTEWFSKAAAQEFPGAEEFLCKSYSNGDGVEKDYKKAEALCRSAVKHGYPKNMSFLPVVLARGNPIREVEAFGTMKIVQSQILYLGQSQYSIYRRVFGEGKTGLTLKAFQMYKAAAVAGQPEAQRAIAHMYYYSDGVDSDYVLASAWALIAKQSITFSTYSLSLPWDGHKYTTKERNEAEALASDWKVGKDLQRL